MIITLIMNRVLGVASYKEIGIFDIHGFNYLESFAWTFVQMSILVKRNKALSLLADFNNI